MPIKEIEALPVSRVGASFVRGFSSEVAHLGAFYVIKSDERVYECAEASGGEQEYQQRLGASLSLIKSDLTSETEARAVLPREVFAPKEHYFIASGRDGLPAPYRVQSFVKGRMLREVEIGDLDEEQRSLLGLLVNAAFEANKRYGRYLDIIGLLKGDKLGKVHSFKRAISPFSNSSNLLISSDAKIALVDIKTAPYRGNLIRANIAKIVLLLGFAWAKLRLRYSMRLGASPVD